MIWKRVPCAGSVVLILGPKLFDIVGGGFGGVALLEEVFHLGWTLRVHSLSPFNLLSACGLGFLKHACCYVPCYESGESNKFLRKLPWLQCLTQQ